MLEAIPHPGATELRFSLRPELRDNVSAWWTGSVLVDAGGAHTTAELTAWLAENRPDALVLGHSHEDHSAGASAVAALGVPVHGGRGTARRLRRPARVPEYRRRSWGSPEPLRVLPPRGLTVDAIALPGHSPDHTGYLDPRTGVLFAGDLLLRRRQRVAMPGEDPHARMASLRAVMAMAPVALATSHLGFVRDPVPFLRGDLDYIEDLASRITRLSARGRSVPAIVDELFGGEPVMPGAGLTWREATGGEFSSARWVRSFLRPARTPKPRGAA